MSRRWVTRFIAPLAAILIAGVPAAAGGWTLPVKVNLDIAHTVVDRPAIALDGPATYIAVAGGAGDRGIRLYTIGQDIVTDNVTTKHDRQPSLVVSDAGVLHLAFSRRGTGCDAQPCTKGIFYARSTDGESWTVERVHRGERDVHPSIALDPDGKPWIFYRSGNRLFEAHRSGGDWTNALTGFGCCGDDPLAGPEGIVVGGQGHIRRSGRSISEFFRLIVRREDQGDPAIVIDIVQSDFIDFIRVTDADDAHDPDITLDTEEDAHVAYRREGDGLWYARIRPNGNVDRTKVADVEIAGQPSIEALPDGHVLIVAVTTNGRLIFRTNDSGDFAGGQVPIGQDFPATAAAAETNGASAARVAFFRDEGSGLYPWFTKHSASW